MVCTACGNGRAYAPNQASTNAIRIIMANYAKVVPETSGEGESKKVNASKGISMIIRVQNLERMMGLDNVYSGPMWANLLNGPATRRNLQIALGKNLHRNELFVATRFVGTSVKASDIAVVSIIDANRRAARIN